MGQFCTAPPMVNSSFPVTTVNTTHHRGSYVHRAHAADLDAIGGFSGKCSLI